MDVKKQSLITYLSKVVGTTIKDSLDNFIKENNVLQENMLSLTCMDGEPKIEISVFKTKEWDTISIVYYLNCYFRYIEELASEKYITITSTDVNLGEEGELILEIGKKAKWQMASIVIENQTLANKLAYYSKCLINCEDKLTRFVKEDYKTDEEVRFEKSISLSNGILTANKFGLALALVTLLFSYLSFSSSKSSSEKLNSSLSELNTSAGNLKTNLDDISSNFQDIQNVITVLDTSLSNTITTLDKEYTELNSIINEIDNSMESILIASDDFNKSAEKFSSTIEKIDYQYSRVPHLEVGYNNCQEDTIGVYIENFYLENKGDISADVKSIAIIYPKMSQLKYESIQMHRDTFNNNSKIDKFRIDYPVNNFLKISPNQTIILEGKFRIYAQSAQLPIKFLITYNSRNIEESIPLILSIEC